jgi:hypothetical protein
MKRPNRLRPVRHSKPTARPQRVFPRVKVEITGADDVTRDAIENAMVRALRNISSEPVTVKLICQ